MTLSEQFATMISMAVMGLWIGGSLTTYHRFIHPDKRWRWIMIFTDIFFWIVQGLLAFLVLLYVNEGHIRFYMFIALLCGFAAYKALFEKIYQILLEKLINITVRTIDLIKKTVTVIIITPLIFLAKLLYQLVKMIGKVLLSILLFLLTILSFPLKWLYMLVFPKRFRQWLVTSFKRLGKVKDWFKGKKG